MLDGAPFLEIPYDHKTSSIANKDLVWVDWVLLQGLYVFQFPAANVVLWYTGGDRRVRRVGLNTDVLGLRSRHILYTLHYIFI